MTFRRFFVGRAIVFALVLLVVGFFALNNYIYTAKQGDGGFQKGYRDTTYAVDGVPIPLVDGVAQTPIPDSSATVVTRVFGNEAEGDLNGDGISDIAFLLTQERGGSGVFYSVVVGLKTDTGYQGTNAVLLGDRIAPQTTEIHDGTVIVNYARRQEGEPMTTAPSIGVSMRLRVVDGVLEEEGD